MGTCWVPSSARGAELSCDIWGRWLRMFMNLYGSPLAVLSAVSRMSPSASALQHLKPPFRVCVCLTAFLLSS